MASSGYDAPFVEDVADYLKCIICHLVLRDPKLLVDCGHRLCNGCFESMKKHATQTKIDLLCPHDRKKVKLNKVVDDKGISRVILDLKVKCDRCQWMGELRNLQTHLDSNCGLEGKKNVSLMKRIESCEKRLVEKDKEILNLRQEFLHSQNQIETLQKGLKHSQEELLQVKKEMTGKAPSSSGVKGKSANNQVSQTQPVSNKKLKERIKSLEKRVMNVVEYIPLDRTVFEWKLKNYAYCAEEGVEVYSPMFYSYLYGHCCKLSVGWYGNKKGRVAVCLIICEGIYEEVPITPFKMGITFETFDISGETTSSHIDNNDVAENCDKFVIEPGEDESVGYGDGHFLKMPAMEDYIIDDILTIKCTLWHNPNN